MFHIDFYSRYPRWLFRGGDAAIAGLRGEYVCRSTAGNRVQRVQDRLMHQTIELSSLQKERFTGQYTSWLVQTRDRLTTLSYDTWMDLRYQQNRGASASFSQGAVVFDLIHGVLYEVRGKDRLRRIFRIQLDGDFPYLSFRDPANAIDFPWITFPGVFTQAELMTLRRVY
ncbi:hypothetical protein FOB83_00040 (plasmid) [Cupriavidus metallidurans]|nr:hypothetical protein FOB83_00040 [Cupriavidus metallidurans]HBD39151.1 hypothetical protein [Cupriavidus sp.]